MERYGKNRLHGWSRGAPKARIANFVTVIAKAIAVEEMKIRRTGR